MSPEPCAFRRAQPPAVCLDCGRPYEQFELDMLLPRWQWLLIHPTDHGLLCAACIVTRASKISGCVAVHAVLGIQPSPACGSPGPSPLDADSKGSADGERPAAELSTLTRREDGSAHRFELPPDELKAWTRGL